MSILSKSAHKSKAKSTRIYRLVIDTQANTPKQIHQGNTQMHKGRHNNNQNTQSVK